MKIIEKIKEVKVFEYEAEDGTVFLSENQCYDYEKKIKNKIHFDAVSKLENLEGYPPCDGANNNEDHVYKWYKVTNNEEVNALNNCFDLGLSYDHEDYVCVENTGWGDYYCQTLTGCKEYVVGLFSKLGFEVSIMEREN